MKRIWIVFASYWSNCRFYHTLFAEYRWIYLHLVIQLVTTCLLQMLQLLHYSYHQSLSLAYPFYCLMINSQLMLFDVKNVNVLLRYKSLWSWNTFSYHTLSKVFVTSRNCSSLFVCNSVFPINGRMFLNSLILVWNHCIY